MVQWSNGLMDQWTNGPMDHWSNQPMIQWSNGPMDRTLTQCSVAISRLDGIGMGYIRNDIHKKIKYLKRALLVWGGEGVDPCPLKCRFWWLEKGPPYPFRRGGGGRGYELNGQCPFKIIHFSIDVVPYEYWYWIFFFLSGLLIVHYLRFEGGTHSP